MRPFPVSPLSQCWRSQAAPQIRSHWGSSWSRSGRTARWLLGQSRPAWTWGSSGSFHPDLRGWWAPSASPRSGWHLPTPGSSQCRSSLGNRGPWRPDRWRRRRWRCWGCTRRPPGASGTSRTRRSPWGCVWSYSWCRGGKKNCAATSSRWLGL